MLCVTNASQCSYIVSVWSPLRDYVNVLSIRSRSGHDRWRGPRTRAKLDSIAGYAGSDRELLN